MAVNEELIAKLREIAKYITEENIAKLTPEEKKIKPADSPIIKRLKMAIEARRIPQLENDLLQEQKKNKQLELKNEKLLENTKKLYGYLGDAWKMVSHLQKDLQTEKQDKVHIQQELTDTLAILNKPTSEMETQTELTAEQISQMEQAITKYQSDIQEKQEQVNTLTNQTTNLQGEIKALQEKVKDKELNDEEKKLKDYLENSFFPSVIGIVEILKILETGWESGKGSRTYDWTRLHPEYEKVRKKLIQVAKVEIERRDCQTQITKLTKDKEELQTKLDIETKTKEELLEYLNYYRGMMVLDVRKGQKDKFNFYSKIGEPHSKMVEAQTSFNNFMKQHTRPNPILYIHLENNDNIDLGNYDYPTLRVWAANAGFRHTKRGHKAELWIKSGNKVWKEGVEYIIGNNLETNMVGVKQISRSSNQLGFMFEF